MYSAQLTIDCRDEDTLYIPKPRDSIDFEVTRSASLENSPESITAQAEESRLQPYGNKVVVLSALPGAYLVTYCVEDSPSQPNVLPESCLGNGEDFTRWRSGSVVEAISQGRIHPDELFVHKVGLLIKSWVQYSYPRDRYEYTDEILPSWKLPNLWSRVRVPRFVRRFSLNEDCLGMHSLLCSILRASEIPAILDVGFRLNGGDSPHTWLWYWNNETATWVMVDLNDADVPLQGENSLPRVSVSLGTNHDFSNITETSDTYSAFLQYFMSRKKLLGERPQHVAGFISTLVS